ncbi:MAG: succinylglutamate desuccinylase/aspartoacylase family protein [Candidatus Thiodiazotropha sp. (ex Ctena orbiculata)]|nr:succinylglutamate desuccinylase/aspartoacylase family protein [Candidatus Thiodiazotropha taylori]
MSTLTIGGVSIPLNSRVNLDLPIAQLHTHTPLNMPIRVWRGKKDGPTLFVSAAIHGDELNGVEIIRRLLNQKALTRLRGTLITIPIVNVYGVIQHSRYLPDRRDLNRNFPGHERGSLAGRLANLFMKEIVANATHGIDLHTGAVHRNNLPQIRANMDDDATNNLAHAFGVPLLINSQLRDGSLRETAAEYGIPMLLYEAGEALRFDEVSIRAGVKGIINVMRSLSMLPTIRRSAKKTYEPIVASSTSWVRAPESGIFRALVPLGSRVKRDQLLGVIASPFGDQEFEVKAAFGGIVIGRTSLPLANEGDALFHIARVQGIRVAEESVENFTEELSPEETLSIPDADAPII